MLDKGFSELTQDDFPLIELDSMIRWAWYLSIVVELTGHFIHAGYSPQSSNWQNNLLTIMKQTGRFSYPLVLIKNLLLHFLSIPNKILHDLTQQQLNGYWLLYEWSGFTWLYFFANYIKNLVTKFEFWKIYWGIRIVVRNLCNVLWKFDIHNTQVINYVNLVKCYNFFVLIATNTS